MFDEDFTVDIETDSFKYNIQKKRSLNYGLYIWPKDLLKTYAVNYLNNIGFKELRPRQTLLTDLVVADCCAI